jgi:ATP-dependent DNA ligase
MDAFGTKSSSRKRMLPALYKLDSHGKVRKWWVEVEDSSYVTRSCMMGGVVKVKRKQCVAVNVGKKNERSGNKQAELRARSAWEKKRNKGGMTEEVDDLSIEMFPISPNCANRYSVEKHGHREWMAQHKYDGHRCIASWRQGEVVLHSRGRKRIEHLEMLKKELEKGFFSVVEHRQMHLDGEIHVIGVKREYLTTLIHSVQTTPITYFVFDLITPDETEPFCDRHAALSKALSQSSDECCVLLVPTWLMPPGDEGIKSALMEAESAGYEGLMLRRPRMKYLRKAEHRNVDMVKVKSFEDAEGKVVSAYCGKDTHQDCIIFDLEDENGVFSVVPAESLDERRNMWRRYKEDPSQFLGRSYSFRFEQRSAYGTPQFATGIGFRHPYDLAEEADK